MTTARPVLLGVGLALLAVSGAAAAKRKPPLVVPACAAPGAEVRVQGRGVQKLRPDVGGVAAPIVRRGPNVAWVVVPAGLPPGPVEVRLLSRAGKVRHRVAFTVRGGEVCDGADNDCNGAVDDGIADVLAGHHADGRPALRRCEGGRFVVVEGGDVPPPGEPGLPAPGDPCVPETIEPCYEGPPETRGVGACRDGARVCTAEGQFGPCEHQVLPGEEDPGNGIDENCDGRDGPGGGELCRIGSVRSCYDGPPRTRNVGECRAGTRMCNPPGRYGPCEDQTLPAPEIEGDGVDQDCDGLDVVVAEKLDLQVDSPFTPTFQPAQVIGGRIGTALGPPPPPPGPFTASLDPDRGRQGETLVVTLTGESAHFEPGFTQVSMGGGVTVEAVDVVNAERATLTVTIADGAAVGPRLVAVSTGRQEALLANAFTVLPAAGDVTGRLVDADGAPVAGAQVCVPGTSVCVTTDESGLFTLPGVATTETRLEIRAAGFLPLDLPVAVMKDGLALGDVALSPSDEPLPPPPPHAPPIEPALARALGRGATVIASGGNLPTLEKLVEDTIIAVGGSEGGVLDANGRQMNPLVQGAGVVSLTHRGVQDVALRLATVDVRSLGDLLGTFLRSFTYGSEPVPRLVDALAGLQQLVDFAWANPGAVESPLVFALFNPGRTASAEPPVLNLDTPLNALQQYLMVSSLMAWVIDTRREPLGGRSIVGPQLARLGAPGTTLADAGTPLVVAQAEPPAAPPAEKKTFSLPWGKAFELGITFLPAQVRSRAIEFCNRRTPTPTPPRCGDRIVQIEDGEQCEPAVQPLCDAQCRSTLSPRPPGCKDVARLVEILVSNEDDARTAASNRFAQFFLSEGATRETAERLRQQYRSQGFQTAWAEARREAEALGLGKAQKLLDFTRGFAEEFLTQVQGEIVGLILNLEVELLVESLRPQPPLITRADQVFEEDGTPLPRVVVRFQRSPNDKAAGNAPNVRWFYQLYRQDGGNVILANTGSVRPQGPGPRPAGDDDRTLVIDDPAASPGNVVYRIVAKRLVGLAPTAEPPTELDQFLAMAAGLVPSVDFATPGGTKLIGGDTLKTILNPMGEILRGLRLQDSPASDPHAVFVSSRPRPPQPPASLVADPSVSAGLYFSVPILNRIFRADASGVLTSFADAGFAAPHQAGLAIDGAGNLYADNAASDAKFGGRLFRFAPPDGRRTLVGTVNKYSFLLQYAKPVSVQALAVGPAPDGEALYVADAIEGAVKRLRLHVDFDPSRNIAQPAFPFVFGGHTAMAFRGDGLMAISQNATVFVWQEGDAAATPLFEGAGPFFDLTGLAFDRAGNLYVADGLLGTIAVVPKAEVVAGLAWAGRDEASRKTLTVVRGFSRPTDVQVTGDQRALAFYDAGGIHVVPFGISGQVTDANGAPIPGAQLVVRERATTAVTDGDGVYVMPGLLDGETTVVDVTIRVGGRTQTARVVLEDVGHTVRDFVFDPPAPPTPSPASPMVERDPPRPPQQVELARGKVTVVDLQVTVPRVAPENPPPAAEPGDGAPALLAPVDGLVTSEPETEVRGFVTDPDTTEVTVIVNGESSTVPVTGGDFSARASLVRGTNTIAVKALPGGPKGALARATREVLGQLDVSTKAAAGALGEFAGKVGPLVGATLAQLATAPPAGTTVPAGTMELAQRTTQAAADIFQRLQTGALPTAVERATLAARKTEAIQRSGSGGLFGGAVRGILGTLDGLDLKLTELNGVFQSATQLVGAASQGIAQQIQGLLDSPNASQAAKDAAQSIVVTTETATAELGSGQLFAAAQLEQLAAGVQELQGEIGGSSDPSLTAFLQAVEAAEVAAVQAFEGVSDAIGEALVETAAAGGGGLDAVVAAPPAGAPVP